MTYNEAYNKIIEAYFKDEIKPLDSEFCFCGTLSGGYRWEQSGYSKEELVKMEGALLSAFPGIQYNGYKSCISVVEEFEYVDQYLRSLPSNEYETILFAGMSAALDILKQIHIERGEVIDETQVFTKRQLA